MKTYCRGYEITKERVWEAYDDWRSHDSGRKNAWRVCAEYGSPQALVSEITEQVRTRTLSFRPLKRYDKREGAKTRHLTIESVKQQICDYVAVRAIQPALDAKLGFWQLGGRHVRSPEDLQRAVKRWEHTCPYGSHGDGRRAYESTSTWTLMNLIVRHFASGDVRYLFWALLMVHGGHLTLGSYLSLKLFQLLMSFAYHHVETLHKTRRGRHVRLARHQCWWADDFWLFGTRKRDLQAAMRAIERFMREELGIELHPWQVQRVGEENPMDVVGRVVRPSRVTLRAKSFLRAYRALRRYRRHPTLKRARSLVSHKGQWLRTDCRGFMARHDVRGALRSAQAHVSRFERQAA